jgi:NAD(P)-dependent dehydrogenase (short-subunit alcohol dehydrogenase family)
MKIQNKSILITGANRGIGEALVNEALRRGAKRVYAGTRGALETTEERVTPLPLDVTNAAQIQQAADQIENLDVLVNNAGISINDDLSDPRLIEQHLAVNFFGAFQVTKTFLPLLRQSRGAIVNNLSVAAIAPLPFSASYSISKAAAASATQSLRMLLASQGVTVHAIFLGSVDTDMTKGLEIPKASPESVAVQVFVGLENGEEDIFPDPLSQSIAKSWRTGVVKHLERQFAASLRRAIARNR